MRCYICNKIEDEENKANICVECSEVIKETILTYPKKPEEEEDEDEYLYEDELDWDYNTYPDYGYEDYYEEDEEIIWEDDY